MAKHVEPTDIESEHSKGRIALWLDPADLEWLSKHCCCPENVGEEQKERCLRMRFRASAALHKAELEK